MHELRQRTYLATDWIGTITSSAQCAARVARYLRFPTIAVLGLVLPDGAISAQPVVQVAEPTCHDCVISLEPVIAVGALDDTATISFMTRFAVAPGGGFVAAELFEEGIIARYDDTGELTGTFGRKGDGPGEFRYDSRRQLLFSSSGDLHVVDHRAGRTILDPMTGAYIASHPIPWTFTGAMLLPGDSLLLVTPRYDHQFQVLDGAGNLARRFGPPGNSAALWMRAVNDSSFWTIHTREYLLEKWTSSGRKLSTVVGKAPTSEQRERLGVLPSRPNSIFEDSAAQLLWVLIFEPDLDAMEDATNVPVAQTNLNDIHSTRIQVIDLASGTLLAESRSELSLRFVNKTGLIRGFDVDDLGLVRAVFFKPTLRRKGGSAYLIYGQLGAGSAALAIAAAAGVLLMRVVRRTGVVR